jgi:hypothetical protein
MRPPEGAHYVMDGECDEWELLPIFIGSTTYFWPQVHADKNADLWLELGFAGEDEGKEGIFSGEGRDVNVILEVP